MESLVVELQSGGRDGSERGLLWRLFRREDSKSSSADEVRFQRFVYQDIVPNRCATGLQDFPVMFDVQRFTPDGRFLIAVGSSRTDLLIYDVEKTSEEVYLTTPQDSPGRLGFRSFFPVEKRISLAPEGSKILDHCLCTESGRFGIFLTAREELLDDVHVCSVDFSTATVVDRFPLPEFERTDPIVHMLDNRIAVLSVTIQVVHILDVREDNGSLESVKTFGLARGYEDNFEIEQVRLREEKFRAQEQEASNFSLDSALHRDRRRESPVDPVRQSGSQQTTSGGGEGGEETAERPPEEARPPSSLSVLMQQALVATFRGQMREGESVSKILQTIETRSHWRIMSIQLLDDFTVLLLFGPIMLNPQGFFLVYSISKSAPLAVFKFASPELLRIYKRDPEIFERASSGCADAVPWIVSFKTAVYREDSLLRSLPAKAQKRNWSPYLDRSVFNYDITVLPTLDGSEIQTTPPRMRTMNRFHDFSSADSSRLLFRLRAHRMLNLFPGTEPSCLFHPHLPLILFGGFRASYLNSLQIYYRA
ncbi:hypothetical protein NDN08_004964 [Rhodosorus marinus]|uniref:DDB1- and CUL4-associated factor 15 WD40 repeat-containing domain-containing protein n=1 Tax=Rhodosorus marinus TaxID=101924 RepID=A0AAV8UGM5_9RHOD|nr:hypothetical protein NDN08_004964 [Rhodosorus marinus]